MPSLSRDVQINPLGTEAAPADFQLPPAMEIVPKMIFASFDGSAAASSFVPLLEVISDSGHKAGRLKAGSTVAAGGSADVTWAPFLEEAAAAPSAGTPSLPSAYTSQFRANVAGHPAQMFMTDMSGIFMKNTADFTLQDANTSMGLGLAGFYKLTSVATFFDAQLGRTYNREVEVQVLDATSTWTPFGGDDLVDYGAMPPGYIAGQASLTLAQGQAQSAYSAIANPQLVNVDPSHWNGLPVHIRPVVNFAASNEPSPLTLSIALAVIRLGDLLA